jgi:hypothetical protein
MWGYLDEYSVGSILCESGNGLVEMNGPSNVVPDVFWCELVDELSAIRDGGITGNRRNVCPWITSKDISDTFTVNLAAMVHERAVGWCERLNLSGEEYLCLGDFDRSLD